MTFEDKKALIDSLVLKVVVHKETIDFHFADAPSLHPMTKRLCKLIAAQPFCHMIITCAKPTEPPRSKLPSKRVCCQHKAFIERLVKDGLAANIIHERLRTEVGFIGSYPTVSKFVGEIRRAMFPGERFKFHKPSACEQYRELIVTLMKEGKGPKGIFEHLKQNTAFAGSQVAVQLYQQRLKSKLTAEGISIPDRSPCAPHRQYIENRTRQGLTPKRILKELQKAFGFTGSYRAVYLCAENFKKEALKAGIMVKTGRSACFPFAELIYSKVRTGWKTSQIWEILKTEPQFAASYDELARFIWRYKRELKAQAE